MLTLQPLLVLRGIFLDFQHVTKATWRPFTHQDGVFDEDSAGTITWIQGALLRHCRLYKRNAEQQEPIYWS